MALIFVKEKRKQQYMFLAFFAVVLITAVVLWQGFLKKPKTAALPTAPRREIKINFELLGSETIKKLQPFSPIPPFGGTAGRENPFLK